MKARILIVEDERAIRLALSGLLRREGYETDQAETGEEAIRALSKDAYDFVLTDLALGSGVSGMDVLRTAREHQPETPVVMITAHGNEKIAVEAMKLGADDYVPKPFDNDEIRLVVRRALERTRLSRENRILRARIERDFGFDNLIGSGPAMRRVFEMIQKVAETDLTVLIRGASGTGKELVAQALHQHSPRKGQPFVAVNCAAISRELVESELFGHEKGAFTGADARRAGRFEAADGGTVFLDEIGDMAPETQAKVLRVLQERSLERVGGTQPIEVDVRVVAATHRDLEADVKDGRFREDLFYRLNVVPVVVPPLRDRRDDIALLADHFLSRYCAESNLPPRELSDEARCLLSGHLWPGNVRELHNAVERLAIMSAGETIRPDDLRATGVLAGPGLESSQRAAADGPLDGIRPATPTAVQAEGGLVKARQAFEAACIRQALGESSGNVSAAARLLGIDRTNLHKKIVAYGLDD